MKTVELDKMSERRKSQVEMAVLVNRAHSRGHQSRPFNGTPLEKHYEHTRPMSRGFGPNLQVQGFGCPLQQRPSSGQTTPRRPSSQPTTEQNNRSLTLLTSLKGKLESSVIPALRSRTRSRPGLKKQGVPCVCYGPGVVSETETPTNRCEGQVRRGSVPELHLYLPSSKCEEDDDSQETRTSAERTSPQESEVKANSPDRALLPKPSCTSGDRASAGPSTPQPPRMPPDDITLDMGLCDLKQPPTDLI